MSRGGSSHHAQEHAGTTLGSVPQPFLPLNPASKPVQTSLFSVECMLSRSTIGRKDDDWVGLVVPASSSLDGPDFAGMEAEDAVALRLSRWLGLTVVEVAGALASSTLDSVGGRTWSGGHIERQSTQAAVRIRRHQQQGLDHGNQPAQVYWKLGATALLPSVHGSLIFAQPGLFHLPL
ncbi:hypothetical protein CONLIGDRAFT_697655 [Coniochaeta ligniaria NRRL 30616]|uniref:Uncharacterized protein n=1 Tax=Coniochaeta ligniaria NRRL 30616 TaxID=1408157 RepID=A0A1J7I496_9PEZI|nr:hypothetical protein CONLIGDRAFT_697655 [Coniochaeta ligniaria NRRL 30616]